MDKRAYELLDRYRVDKGGKFRLRDFDQDDTYSLKNEFKTEAKALLQEGVEYARASCAHRPAPR